MLAYCTTCSDNLRMSPQNNAESAAAMEGQYWKDQGGLLFITINISYRFTVHVCCQK